MGSLSLIGGNKVVGPGAFTPSVAGVIMGYWTMRVIVWPDALIEAIIVVPLGVLVLWRFLRVGIWIGEGDLLVRNAWESIRVPLDEVDIRAGYVDDISEFDRFTGGQTNEMRRRVGDQFAERTFLRHRIVVDGEEEDIDAFFGRTPKSQSKAAQKLFAEIERAKIGLTQYRPG